jgi:hypothetical protein
MPFVGIGNILGGGSAKISYAKQLAKAYEARVIADGGVVESLGCFTAFAKALGASKSTFDADYQAVLDYATTQGYTLPSAGQRTLQNQLVVDLKAGGIWSKLDTFAVFATDGDSDYALIDWKRLSDYTAFNSPTFTTNEGFTGNGTSSYINTNWNPNTQGVNYTQNDACFGGWRLNNINNPASRFMGATITISMRDDNNVVHRINGSGNASSSLNGAGIGLRVLNRTNSTDIQMIVDNTLQTSTQTSVTPPSSNLHLLSRGDGSSFSLSQIATALAGANLVTESTDLYNALNTYITSI